MDANEEFPRIKVFRSDRGAARAPFLPDARLSFGAAGALIHADPDRSAPDRETVQAAAKELAGLGYRRAELAAADGRDWPAEEAYAFFLGFRSVRHGADIVYPERLAHDELFMTTIRVIGWLRDVTDEPASALTPESYAGYLEKLNDLAGGKLAISALRGEELARAGAAGLLAVGAGSAAPPCLYEIDCNPSGDPREPVFAALVGKGITFDTGGCSLKPAGLMVSMHSDMCGSATVAAAAALLAARGFGKRIRAFLCCAENMVSGSAMRPGDVIRYPNGVSVVVGNTDAEGRLALADGLLRAAAVSPEYIVDAATLTGAAKVALGRDYNAALSYNPELTARFAAAARAAGERAWPLPLEEFHAAALKSPFADVTNAPSGDSVPGASAAAAFLGFFVPKEKRGAWLHVDLAAAYRKTPDRLYQAGATGHGARSLAGFIAALAGE